MAAGNSPQLFVAALLRALRAVAGATSRERLAAAG
jgi:hypothetical protein